jgi:hypothetical protein
MLYDIGTLPHSRRLSNWRIEFMKTLTGNVLQMISKPSLLQAYLALHGYDHEMGECWRTSNNTFHFYFKGVSSISFQGKISEEASAPSSSFSGTKNEGAVPWLHITPMSGSLSGHDDVISVVYQYYTSGGEPSSRCASSGQVMRTPYAAQYWIYKSPKRENRLMLQGL